MCKFCSLYVSNTNRKTRKLNVQVSITPRPVGHLIHTQCLDHFGAHRHSTSSTKCVHATILSIMHLGGETDLHPYSGTRELILGPVGICPKTYLLRKEHTQKGRHIDETKAASASSMCHLFLCVPFLRQICLSVF